MTVYWNRHVISLKDSMTVYWNSHVISTFNDGFCKPSCNQKLTQRCFKPSLYLNFLRRFSDNLLRYVFFTHFRWRFLQNRYVISIVFFNFYSSVYIDDELVSHKICTYTHLTPIRAYIHTRTCEFCYNILSVCSLAGYIFFTCYL